MHATQAYGKKLLPLLLLVTLLLSLLPIYPSTSSGAAAQWAPNTAYKAKDLVSYNGVTYECLQPHTSLNGWEPPNVASLWKKAEDPTPTPSPSPSPNPSPSPSPNPSPSPSPNPSPTPSPSPGTGAPAWQAGTAYKVGDLVSYNGKTYKALAAHTALVGWEPATTPTLWKLDSSDPTKPEPTTPFCAPDWSASKIYAKGKIVGYKGKAYRAISDVHGIAPDDTTYNMWEVAGKISNDLCPVSIPNNIDYGTANPGTGNTNAGKINPTGAISAGHPVSGTGTGGTKGGIDPATDPGGNHPGFDADTGGRVAKLPSGTLPLQHNTYEMSAGQEVVEYLGDWAIYGRRFDFSKLPVKNVNRLVYGFAGVCFPAAQNTQDPGFPTTAPASVNRTCKQSKLPDGAMAIADFEAAFLRTLPGQTGGKITGTESMYDLDPNDVAGVFGALYQLRKTNPNLKLDLSVGGWTLSEGFPWMASDTTRRKAFVDSVVRFLEQFGFDGVDIDWEYPASDGAVIGMARKDDPENYIKLLKELRAGLDWLTKKTGKEYRLSSAIPATEEKLAKIDWAEASKYLNRLYAMTYDLSGAWERELGHHTPLYPNPNAKDPATGKHVDLSLDTTVKLLKGYGVPANKIMIGIANYHRSKAMKNGDITEYTNGLIGKSTFGDLAWKAKSLILGIAGVGSWEAGVVEGYDLYQNYLDKDLKPKNGYKLYTDKAANADYLVNPIGSFITVETPRTVALKTQYAKDNGLAGIFGWQLEQDNGYNLNALNHILGNKLVSDVSDGKPKDQIAVCGQNVTAAECDQLNASLKK
ncbi:glycosyl hydrolase family 18 protein [Paenibacillus chitinolyticus]|uniref:glycosyl hydrolase family 18 protein n=1 Tax=Paenibacillus chitinolyticus TaxID=79263 RepID=UPI0035DEF59D